MLQILDLNPSLTIYPLRLKAGLDPKVVLTDLRAVIQSRVINDPATDEQRKTIKASEILDSREATIGSWEFTGVTYQTSTAPSWLARKPAGKDEDEDEEDGEPDDDEYRQLIWHLALVGIAQSHPNRGRAVVHATQESIANVLREWLVAGRFGETRYATPCADPFADKALQAVCLKGKARQTALWGIHRSVTTKADRKTLLGVDLREAVDPFIDQTYRLTSAVSVDKQRQPEMIGLALAPQRVWSSRRKNIQDYVTSLDQLFDQLEAAQTHGQSSAGLEQPGFKILARPIGAVEIRQATLAFDAAFRPLTDLLPMPEGATPADSDIYDARELAWFEDGDVRFVSGSDTDASVVVEAWKANRKLTTLTVSPAAQGEVVSLQYTAKAHVDDIDPDLELFEGLIAGTGLERRLAVWYNTGHALIDGQVTLVTYQDVRFNEWRWLPFKNQQGAAIIVSQEKPMKAAQSGTAMVADLANIGNSKSLFDYILEVIPAELKPVGGYYVICDDGAGEIADFIFFDPKGRKLCLIHAKASNSDSEERRLSVSAYEQVVSQARKNLRYFDTQHLAAEIQRRADPPPALWRGTQRVPDNKLIEVAKEICDKLNAIKYLDDKHLVVMQPHVRKASWGKARTAALKGENTVEVKGYRLLCTLLADLQMTAQKIDARLTVIGHDDD